MTIYVQPRESTTPSSFVPGSLGDDCDVAVSQFIDRETLVYVDDDCLCSFCADPLRWFPPLVGVELNPGPPKKGTTVVEVVKTVQAPQAKSKKNRQKGGGQPRMVTMRDIGASAGSFLGDMASRALSAITGSGDYTVSENTLYQGAVQSNSPPQFVSKAPGCSRILHREYVSDISTVGSAFNLTTYQINPTSAVLFPWLSQIAVQFESYRFRGLVFEFKTTSATAVASTNTALGTVILATQYNIDDNPFTSKIQMDQYEYSVSTVPFMSAIHPVECARGSGVLDYLYTYQSAGGDARFTTFGNFNIATVGQQSASTIGELWVSYDIELCKPRLGINPESLCFHRSWSNSSGISFVVGFGDLFNINGGIQYVDKQGTLGVTMGTTVNNSPNKILFPVNQPGTFEVNVYVLQIASDAFSWAVPTTGNGATLVNAYSTISSGPNSTSALRIPENSAVADFSMNFVVTIPPGLPQTTLAGLPFVQLATPSIVGNICSIEVIVLQSALSYA